MCLSVIVAELRASDVRVHDDAEREMKRHLRHRGYIYVVQSFSAKLSHHSQLPVLLCLVAFLAKLVVDSVDLSLSPLGEQAWVGGEAHYHLRAPS